MDSIVFNDTVSSEISQSEFVDKQWIYVNDMNNSSYSSQIQLDTTALSNSGAYLNYSEAFILMPLILQIESTAATLTSTSASDYLAGLKSGYWNMIHSMTVELNNNNIVQQVPFSNVFANFKCLSSWSDNDVQNWGSVCGFSKDSANSWAYLEIAPVGTNILSASGSGLSNNRNAPYVSINGVFNAVSVYVAGPPISVNTSVNGLLLNTSTVATQMKGDIRQNWNNGFLQRQQNINYNTDLTASNLFSSNQGFLMNANNCASVFRSFSNALNNVRYYQIDAVIRLKDYSDFFNKVPLLKGASLKLYLNTNQCFFSISQSNGQYNTTAGANFGNIVANPLLNLASSPSILGGGGTNPLLYSSAGLGQGSSVLTPFGAVIPAAIIVNVAISIVKTQFTQMTNTYSCPISSVRLYVPAYILNPMSESRLLSLSPTKRIVYNDIFQYSFPNQQVNSPFNILVTNGIPNIRSVLVMPFLPAVSNGVAAAGFVRSSTLLSPFCSTPASPDPLIIQNFQIQLSGKNLFNNQLQFDYETFAQQLVSSNQLNGGLTTALSSGLISKSDFQNLYRYYYANCSRSLSSEQGVSKSIQIQGTILGGNLTTVIDLMVFVEYEKSITVDLRTGAIIGV
jgi:hypothetical protein